MEDHTPNSYVLVHILQEGWGSSVSALKRRNPAVFKEIKGRHYLVYRPCLEMATG